MHYYQIIVRNNRVNLNNPLIYHSNIFIKNGSLICVELHKQEYIGIIISSTKKPKFKTKPILSVYNLPGLNKSTLQLIKWLKMYYPSTYSAVLKLFIPNKINDQDTADDLNLNSRKSSHLVNLTPEQSETIAKIKFNQTYLLHGRTASGKTRIYQELAVQAIGNTKSVIILTPEIYLTNQLYDAFQNITNSKVYLIHSKLNLNKKQKIWVEIMKSKKPIILIGPRSALFYPVNNLGLIIIDEFHDNSYKSESHPKYQTVRVASMLRRYTDSKLILGSATPNVAEYYLAKHKNIPIIELKKTAIKQDNAEIDFVIVDLKDNQNFKNSKIISDQLINSINQSMSKNEQSLIFLNRRGTSRLILCKDCGWENLCKNCNLPLIYHKDKNYLICHSCGRIFKDIPFSCPICNSTNIIYKTPGIKAVEEEFQKIFSNSRIARIDSDSKVTETLMSYEAIKKNEIDIIIGTQLITKGLDLPNLSTVGLIQADSSLYIPDYTSKEKTYQLLTQVLGRTNRGHKKGRLIIQSYNIKSNLLENAISQNYINFYKQEIVDRKKYQFPPFYNLLKLTNQKSTPLSANNKSNELITKINKLYNNIIIEGPSPSYRERINNKYESQIIIKSKNRSVLNEIISILPSGWDYDIDPNNLL